MANLEIFDFTQYWILAKYSKYYHLNAKSNDWKVLKINKVLFQNQVWVDIIV
jgi:hypothetical protein